MSVVLRADTPVFVAGHRGLVGSALVRRLEAAGCANLLVASREELDLRDPVAVLDWMGPHRPEVVFLAAGTVGGILANTRRPAEFLYDNLMIHASVVEASRVTGVRKLLSLGSSCIYPRDAAQPITEEALLHRTAGAHQRAVRGGQDRRHPPVRDLSGPVRVQLHLGHAHQPLRPRRQLRPRAQPRAPRHDPEVRRRPPSGRPVGGALGLGPPETGVPPRRRPGRRLPLPHGALRRGRPRQRRHRRGRDHRRVGGPGGLHRPPRGDRHLRRRQARRHAPQGARRDAAPPTWAGGPASPSSGGSPRPTPGTSTTALREPVAPTTTGPGRWDGLQVRSRRDDGRL